MTVTTTKSAINIREELAELKGNREDFTVSGTFTVSGKLDVNADGDITFGTDQVFFDASTGRVGIGTASPATALDVVGTITGTEFNIAEFSTSTNLLQSNAAGQTGARLRAAVSSAPNPTFSFSDDTDTGMFRAAADTLGFGTAGTERMRIDSSGNLLMGKTSTSTTTAGVELREDGYGVFTRASFHPVLVNRLTDDGDLVRLQQGSSTEGSISVSGTTVSYNGGHLSRWSRLPVEQGEPTLYKGTVMTNLDAMVVWETEAVPATYWEEGDELPEGVSVGDIKTGAIPAGQEDNEQLNETEVSSVEGDPNVAGLFVAWDESDELGDYYLAMTGDLVIRIAEGVTVQRGDLLMSAGDGTAKPQGDDIVRSKTIAKVTSTNVSHTYPDGSYAVPCVVMAC